jgi:hypothetical protein
MRSIHMENRFLSSNRRSATLSIRPHRSLCVDLRKGASWARRELATQGEPAFSLSIYRPLQVIGETPVERSQ